MDTMIKQLAESAIRQIRCQSATGKNVSKGQKMHLKNQLRAAALASFVLAGNAMAAVPAEVTTAITDGMADGKTIAYALLGLAITIGVIMFIKRKMSS